jgi:hypothetical protein
VNPVDEYVVTLTSMNNLPDAMR